MSLAKYEEEDTIVQQVHYRLEEIRVGVKYIHKKMNDLVSASYTTTINNGLVLSSWYLIRHRQEHEN